eukprot:282218-Prorocentrum_minimum.AAC.1
MVASSPEEPVGESRKEAFHVSNVKEGFRDSKRSSRARTKRCLKVRALVDSSCTWTEPEQAQEAITAVLSEKSNNPSHEAPQENTSAPSDKDMAPSDENNSTTPNRRPRVSRLSRQAVFCSRPSVVELPYVPVV